MGGESVALMHKQRYRKLFPEMKGQETRQELVGESGIQEKFPKSEFGKRSSVEVNVSSQFFVSGHEGSLQTVRPCKLTRRDRASTLAVKIAGNSKRACICLQAILRWR